MKAAAEITDRAKRYRANRTPPPGRRVCNFCGRKKNIDIDHVDGDESDDAPDNKIYLCRECNTRKGIIQTRNRIGVRTRQYNPPRVPTFAQFKHHAAVLLGIEAGDAGESTRAIKETPPATRARYAQQIAANPAPTFDQYRYAVSIHDKKTHAHDEGGKIIHATPKYLRREYAAKIADFKRERRGEVPF
jgi:uncharacterized protein YlaI